MEVTPCVLKEIRMEVTPKRTMMNMLVFELHDEYVGLSKFMISFTEKRVFLLEHTIERRDCSRLRRH